MPEELTTGGPSREELLKIRATTTQLYGFIHSPTEVPKGATPVSSAEDYDPKKYAEYISKGKAKLTPFGQGDAEYKKVNLLGQKVTSAIVFTGSAKTVWGQWQEVARSLPNGPYYMDGRDGELVIHNRKTNAPTGFVYTYAGGNGELLTFQIKSKMGTQSADAAQSTDIDGDEKEVTVDIVQNYTSPNSGLYVYEPNAEIPEVGPQIDKTRVDLNSQREKLFSYRGIDNNQGGSAVIDPDTIQTFKSEEEAIEYYRDGAFTGAIEFTPEEATRLNRELIEFLKGQQNPRTEAELDELIHINNPHNFYITRTVRVRQALDPYQYGGRAQLTGGGGLTENYYNQSRSRVQQRRIGEKYIRDNYTVVGYKQHKLGQEGYVEWGVNDAYPSKELNTLPEGMESVQGKQYNTATKLFVVEVVKDIAIPLNIIHLFGGILPVGGIVESLENDMGANRENQVKAKATIVGRPAVESSMNLLIQNVSSKYSGVWYTKEVTHKINPSVGYQCEIEFVQRDIPVVRNQIHTSMSTANLAWNLLADDVLREKAKKSFETGDWEIPIKLRAQARALSKKTKLNIAIAQDANDPTQTQVMVGGENDNNYSGWLETRDQKISLDMNDLSFSNPAHGLSK